MCCASRTRSLSDAVRGIKACSAAKELLLGSVGEGVAVVHHWDADGVASAAAVVRLRGESIVSVVTPELGVYGTEAIPWKSLDDAEVVAVIDYGIGLTPAALGRSSRLLVIDHHRSGCVDAGLCCNPVSVCGLGEAEVPATAYLMRELLAWGGRDGVVDDLAALGIVGDMGAYLDRLPDGVRGFLNRACGSLGISLKSLLRAADVVDACYRNLRYGLIRRAVTLLAEGGPAAVLGDPQLLRNYGEWERVREGVMGLLEREAEFCGSVVKVFRLRADSLVTSYVGRRLASELGGVIVLIHELPSLNRTYVYVRSRESPIVGCREAVERAGLKVGGKDYVLVVTCGAGDEACVNKAVSTIVRRLCGVVG